MTPDKVHQPTLERLARALIDCPEAQRMATATAFQQFVLMWLVDGTFSVIPE